MLAEFNNQMSVDVWVELTASEMLSDWFLQLPTCRIHFPWKIEALNEIRNKRNRLPKFFNNQLRVDGLTNKRLICLTAWELCNWSEDSDNDEAEFE